MKGKEFKIKRQQAGFATQEALVDYWGVSVNHISKLERDDAVIRQFHIDSLELLILKASGDKDV